MNIRENSLCPLCDEDDETSVHLLGNCPATMVNRNALMGACTLTLEDLRGFHWSILLSLPKTQVTANLSGLNGVAQWAWLCGLSAESYYTPTP